MAHDPTQDAKDLDALLNSRALGRLMEASKCHRSLDKLIHAVLPPEIVSKLTSFCLEGNTILLYVKNSAWATRLRGSTSDLLYAAERYRELRQVRYCKVLIRQKSDVQPSSKRGLLKKRPDCSAGTVDLLQTLADDCQHDELKASLQRLSQTLRSNHQ